MAVSKGVLVGLSIFVLVMAVVVGFLVGYFTKSWNCDPEEDNDMRSATRVYHHAPGPCDLVDGIDIGSEDMVVLESGKVLITSGLKVLVDVTKPPYLGRQGSLKVFDFNKPNGGVKDLTILFKPDSFDLVNFNPQGITTWNGTENSGKVYVFVVNHGSMATPGMTDSVEKFELDEVTMTLTHIERITDKEHFHYLNNLVATGPNSFYYTNSAKGRTPAELKRELDEGVKSGSVGYFDGETARIVTRGLLGTNGINMSPDSRFVYVAQFGPGLLTTFVRMPDNSLVHLEDYKTCLGADNIDTDGNYLWLGCHPDIAVFVAQHEDPINEISPSQALRLRVEEGRVTEVVEVFADDGSLFSAISVAVRYQDAILMGSVNAKALYCQVSYIG